MTQSASVKQSQSPVANSAARAIALFLPNHPSGRCATCNARTLSGKASA